MAMPDENTVFEWTAVIMGAEDTDWEGACLKLRMKFADTYPNKAPEIKFVTKMFHPNIYKDGRICLDILNEKWTPSYSVHTILTSIQQLLADPNNDSPANLEASQMHRNNFKEYQQRVKSIVEKSQEEMSDGDEDEDEEAIENVIQPEEEQKQDDEEMKESEKN